MVILLFIMNNMIIGNSYFSQNSRLKLTGYIQIFSVIFLIIIYPIALYRIYLKNTKSYKFISIIIVEIIFCIILCFSLYMVFISPLLYVGIYLDIFYILGIVAIVLLFYLEGKIAHGHIRRGSIVIIFVLIFVLGYSIYNKYGQILNYEKRDIKSVEFKLPKNMFIINGETYDRKLITDKKVIEDLFNEINSYDIKYIGDYRGISNLNILEKKTEINTVLMNYGDDKKYKDLEEGYIDSIRFYGDEFSTIVINSSDKKVKYQYKVNLSKESINRVLNAPNEVLPFENYYILERKVKEYIEKLGYKIVDNSEQTYYLRLPKDFNYMYSNYNIGNFLKDKNEMSKKNGYDFSKYMGKDIKIFNYKINKEDTDTENIYFLFCEDDIIGVWQEDSENNDELSILKTYTEEIRKYYTFKDLKVNEEDLNVIKISKDNKKYKTINDKNEVDKLLRELNKYSLKLNEDVDKNLLNFYYHIKIMNDTRSNLIDIKRCEQNILMINDIPYTIINGNINYEDFYSKGKEE
ncbi:DUF4830 domain-containing protein [uncultured Clostridium sp.]|uniref:DUF4830 domain-containing protein n=1 Tax=uncultured Clostridium sp. TaxID=59620 RepID=UPI00258FC0BD|nr:DUF4830 domain-containing protein [uncultured Clostridium sp.]MDU1348392.1 DUF4830 domain-containing protein [Clostridium argentinense]